MTNESNPNSQPAHHPGTAPDQKPISPRLALLGVAVLLIVALLLAGYGILSRRSAAKLLSERTTDLAAPTVIAATPRLGAPADSFILPGNVTAYTDSPIYARTSGYLTASFYPLGTLLPARDSLKRDPIEIRFS